ncbi:MAG: glycosyltransferase family 2 protein [Bacteroidales bacterium]|jgi:glycosyltransferase involved in cell wall biosynthesis|nr:glycosyltransferase family 2 protein [Bacteroidales bacterium]
MDISIVIPLLNEEESLPELTTWIYSVMEAHHFTYEIIFVDDGSSDNSWAVIEQLRKDNSNIHGIRFQRNYGKSAALNVGFEQVQGDVVITMDADLQDSPDEIPELFHMVKEQGYDLVSGWKKVRYDSKIAKNIPSKFFNWTTRRLSKIKLHDFNCGLKAYRNNVVKSIEVYGEMHRYIPVIAKWAGFNHIGEKTIKHQKRKFGTTKFGWSRFINGYLDLISITFVSKFGKRPMHFFGLGGTFAFLLGFVITIWLIIEKLRYMSTGVSAYRQVTDQPLFYLALLAMIFGLMMFLAGFLGEMISRNSVDRNRYIIRERTK